MRMNTVKDLGNLVHDRRVRFVKVKNRLEERTRA